MFVRLEISSIYEMRDELWGQAQRNLDALIGADLENEAYEYIEELFNEGDYTITDLNDYVAYQLIDDLEEMWADDEGYSQKLRSIWED